MEKVMDPMKCRFIVKEDGHSKKRILLLFNANKNTGPQSAGFPYEIRVQRSPKLEHRCRHFEQQSATRLRFRDFILSERFCSNGFRRAF